MATLADWVNGLLANQAKQAGLDPVIAKVMANYGYLAGYLEHPEIGPLLREAATQGWSKEILQGRLYQTAWWKSTASARREMDTLAQTDPAEYNQRLNGKVQELSIIAQRGGAAFSTYKELRDLALKVLSDPTITPDVLNSMVFAHASFTGRPVGGQMGSTMDSIKKRADEYLVPMSDATAFGWSKRIQQGLETVEGVDTYLRTQAKSRFSHLAEELDRGATTKELFDPYIQQTAQLLEVAPATINLQDPMFMNMISTKDADTGKVRAMTLSEAGEYVRRSDAYDQTQQATNKVAQFTENMAGMFGKVKS
jgi:hypothetical protein